MVKPIPRVLVTRQLPGTALDDLEADCDVTLWPHEHPPSPAQLKDACRDVDGLLCTLNDVIDQSLIDAATRLKVVSSCSVGVDHVDQQALARRSIALGHTPHVLTDATADLCMALMLSASRRLPEGEHYVRSGAWARQPGWDPQLLLGRDLRGATLGLLGLGPIGQAVARRALAFGLNILGWTPSGRKLEGVTSASFDQVIERSDILSLHLALTPQTRAIISADTLARMPRHSLLINTARGGLIDENALIQALNSGDIGAAALDVFCTEPLAADHALLSCPNLTLAPHLGSATHGTRAAMTRLAVNNLLAGLRGETLPHAVNLSGASA